MKNNIKDRCCGNGNIVEEFLMDRNNPDIMKCAYGRVGPTGSTGPTLYRDAYLVIFNYGTSAEGIAVEAGERLPIDREEFDPETDFVSIGFRQVGTDNIFIGASEWSYYEEAKQIVGEGLIAIENIANAYELVNLGKTNIYLNSPDLKNISSGSYFTNPIVTIIIEYKGRQGA